jgi:hypothetical protein
MSKNKSTGVKTTVTAEQSDDAFEAALKSEPEVFDVTSLALSPTAEGFNLVKITLASKTLNVGSVEVIDTAQSKAEAIEKFKINAIRLKVI